MSVPRAAVGWLVFVLVGQPCIAETISQSPRQIPVAREVDVVVIGGSVAAVAAATKAASDGARVFLAAPRTYLGEDLCGEMRLWRDGQAPAEGNLAKAMFGDRQCTTPLHVKMVLEQAMIDADAEFLLACYPTDLLVDAQSQPAGVVIANRAGRQAVLAKVIVDATDRGVVAKWAGASHQTWLQGNQLCHRVVLAPQGVAPEHGVSVDSGEEYFNQALFYHQHAIQLDLGDGSFRDLARAEQQARDLTFDDSQLRAAERFFYRPTDQIIGKADAQPWQADQGWRVEDFQPKSIDRMFVLGPAADLPPAAAERLMQPENAEAAGRLVGAAAGKVARSVDVAGEVVVAASDSLASESADEVNAIDVRELLAGLRPTDVPQDFVRAPRMDVPVLADVDVVVVGGGTSGACAAIGAARRGARVIVVEYQEGLGGVGTVGLIGKAYHGLDLGFTREVPFCDETCSNEQKMEWFRRQILDAGGEIWLGVLGCGAVVRGDSVVGTMIATPQGRGAILADVVIDATGNGDVAVAAGADSMYGAVETDLALQGTGLPMRPLGIYYKNSDYLLVDETDLIDVWRALVGVRLNANTRSYDMGTFIQTRERRRVVGDHKLTYLDQLSGRTYPDTIVLSGSDYDSHGYPSDPFFALIPHTEETLKANHPAPGGTCYTPYRCLLPKGLEGILVTGLAISMHRDASAMVRMQKDMHNQGFAAGAAAAMAAEDRCTPRQINIYRLQTYLVEMGNLPAEILGAPDSFPLSEVEIDDAIASLVDPDLDREAVCKALAIVLAHSDLAHSDLALPKLRDAFAAASGDSQLVYARILGVLGDPSGASVLIEHLEKLDAWDAKILQGGAAEYAHLPTPMDALILALGYGGDARAVAPILAKLDTLDHEVTLSHHRSVALALESLGDPAAAEPLARLLNRPKMRGHVMKNLEPLYNREVDKRRRNDPLREIVLARALYRCGDWRGIGESILNEYRDDLRGLFARHATAVLQNRRSD